MNLPDVNTTYTILGTIIVALVGLVAIQFSFNINTFLENRRKNKQERLGRQLQSCCMHMKFSSAVDNNGAKGIETQSLFSSPPGTLEYYCSQCGLVVPYLDEKSEKSRINRLLDKYLKDPEQFQKELKRFIRVSNKFIKL